MVSNDLASHDPAHVSAEDPTPAANADAEGTTISVGTLAAFLVGRREAILKIASTPSVLGVGAMLVLSAGLARNYDKPALWREPWRLLGPYGASLATSGLLFVLIFGIAWFRRMIGPGALRSYRAFLTVYWATAPLAWLYGIPFEKMLSPLKATEANLWMLGLVSIWRVALMARVVSVMIGVRAFLVFVVMMIVVDAVVWSAIVYSPVPLIQVMSGVEDPKAMLISNAAISVLMLSTISFPVWLILGVLCAYVWRPVWSVPDPRPARKAWPLYLFAACSITVWAILAIVI